MSRLTNPVEELVRRAAHRETFRNVAHQLQCLKRFYNVLYGETADTASRSNQIEQVSPQQQQPNSRAFILRKLKYALRTQYEDCFPLPPPDRCSVLLLFDTNEEAFFEIRLKPKAWPEDWPTRFDCGSAGIDVELYSLAIYMKVLEALREDEENGGTGGVLSEPTRVFGVVNSSGTGDGPRSSVVEENGLTRVIVKSEEKEIAISDEEEEEAAENNVHANEQVNSSGSNQLPFSNTIKQEPTDNNSISLITRKRPLESTSSSALQNPLPLPPSVAAAAARAPQTRARDRALPAAFASAFASSSHQLNNSSRRSPVEMNEMIAVADRFTASSAYQSISGHYLMACPLCSSLITKRYMTDHLNVVHLGRRYHCAWPGCAKAFSYRHIGHKHLRQAHKSTAYEQYLQCRE